MADTTPNLTNNTAELDAVWEILQNKAAGPTSLPELTNPGVAEDLLRNKQLIDGDGNIVIGAMPNSSRTFSGGDLVPLEGKADAEGVGIVLGTKTPTQPTSGKYITVTGQGKVGVNAIKETATAGYCQEATRTVVSSNMADSQVATAYYPISSSVVDTADANALSSHLVSGQTAYVNGEKITGSLIQLNKISPGAIGTGTARVGSVVNPVVGISMPTLEIYGQTMANGYVKPGAEISAHVALTSLGDATAADVIKGKTFTSTSGLKITGTKEDIDYPQSSLSNTVWIYNSSITYQYSDIVNVSETALYCPCQLMDSNGNNYGGFYFTQDTNGSLGVTLVEGGFPKVEMLKNGAWVGKESLKKLTIKTTDVHPTALVFLSKYFKLKTPNENINISTLANTMWFLDKDLGQYSSDSTFSLNFIANGVSYSSLRLWSPSGITGLEGSTEAQLTYGSSNVCQGGFWVNQRDRFVTVVGGSAATNIDLMDWFKTHGTLLS